MAGMHAPHAARRAALLSNLGQPILLVSNGERSRNLPINRLPYRADSTFLYYTGCAEPGAVALLESGRCTLFLNPPEPDDALWHGEVESLEERGLRYGVDSVRPLSELEASIVPNLCSIAVPDDAATALASRLTGLSLPYPSLAPTPLIEAIIRQRRRRDEYELMEMRKAAKIAEKAHIVAMQATRPGGHEREIAALFDAVVAAEGAVPSYHSIVTVRGEILHNPSYLNRLRSDQMLLLDGGAEVESGYASDVTRTWPVRGRFDARQQAAYELVLAAQESCISKVRAGTRYRDIHDHAGKILAEGLKDLSLLACNAEEAVETGAVGLFFPHGVGHLIGLDVHDLENFGDQASYAPGRKRPTTFGARNLRMDLDLEADMVVTIEPGLYFVPAILHDPTLRQEHRERVRWEEAEMWLGFGGIRIEDDVRVTMGEPEVLTAGIPKSVAAIEELVGKGRSAFERLYQ